jgi:hypothetical protein
LQKNKNKNNNNKLEMEKGEEETLDESSIIRQESVESGESGESGESLSPNTRERERACKIQAGNLQIEAIEE